MLPLGDICACLLFQFLILILFSEVLVNNYTFNEIKANGALKTRDLHVLQY